MLRKTFSVLVLMFLLNSMVASTFVVQLSRAEEAASVESDVGSLWMAADWNKTYGGTSIDVANSVVQATYGGYALGGYTGSYGAGSYDFWLVKTDSSGTTEWNRTYGGSGADYAYSAIETTDGGYALAGYTNSYGAGSYDAWLVMTDEAGNAQWNKTYGRVGSDYCQSLTQTSDGGYALAGYTGSYGAGGSDFWLIKTDSSGNEQWNKTYGGTYDDYCLSFVQASDGGYALAGYTNSFGAGNSDLWLVKTDSSGNAQWNKTYGGTSSERAYSLVQTSDGGYALAGYTDSFGSGFSDFWLVKTNSSGNVQWNRTYGRSGLEVARSVVQATDGGYALVGYTNSSGSYDYWFIKTDSSGNGLWNKTYGGVNDDYGLSLVQTGDGGYALAGYTYSFGAGSYDAWLIKLTPITIYILADGSVDPLTAPIQRNGSLYTLTDNIYTSATYGIAIQRNDMTLDGAGYTIQGNANYTGIGIYLLGRSNVTIKNTRITAFCYAIHLHSCSNNTMSGNNLTNNDEGVFLQSSSGNTVYGNNLTANNVNGLWLLSSDHNSVNGNYITANSYYGIGLYFSSNTTVSGNSITNNEVGIYLDSSSNNNTFYHNNFVSNTQQVTTPSLNVWDDGYSSGGNYWSDYNGTDLYRGAYQNMTGSDGIGDTPYFINVTNRDRYPFMSPLARAGTGLNITVYPIAEVSLIFGNVTRTGFASAYKTDTLPEWMLPLPGLVGRYVDVIVTAGTYGKITVAVSYDDINMTEEEENNLQLLQWKGCDVTGTTPGTLDGIVNMRDIGYFCSKFLVPGGSDPWDPRCDVTGATPSVPDGVVNMRDIGEVCSNFMGTNHWTDITTYIDTVNNIIYGETTHFSMFGVTRE